MPFGAVRMSVLGGGGRAASSTAGTGGGGSGGSPSPSGTCPVQTCADADADEDGDGDEDEDEDVAGGQSTSVASGSAAGHHDTRMSRRKWRYETGAERAVKQANGRDLINILPVLQHLPDGSLKSASVQVLSQRLRDVWVFHWGQLWAHYGVRWWGQQRFRQAIKHQRVLDHIADQVLGPKHDRIAVFGDGVFPPSMKGIPPAPVTMVRDYLARKGRVVLLDEGLTSKTCCQCHSVMRQHASLHATKHCKSAIHTWSWNRDVNAARNIAYLWKCYMAGLDRPAAFRPRPRLPARNTLHRAQPGSDPSAGL